MCVIAAFTRKDVGREGVLACLDRAYSRGPDLARTEETPSGWLGFRRLSIMGLDESGMQPFALGADRVVCNGELYGWRRQREELERKGYVFRSGSDCELLLPLYQEYGLGMFSRLDAEFALVLYDGEADEYIAARDPIGIRPLFYGADAGGGMVFASEAKQLVGLCKEIIPFPPGHYWYRGNFVRYADPARPGLRRTDGVDAVCRNIHDMLNRSWLFAEGGHILRPVVDLIIGFVASGKASNRSVVVVKRYMVIEDFGLYFFAGQHGR